MNNVTRAQQQLRTEIRKDNLAIAMAVGFKDTQPGQATEDDRRGGRRSISINITEEALRIGKLPTESVARNIA